MTKMSALAGWLVYGAAGVSAIAQVPTFTSKVEAVRVDVLVTQGGQPVRGLGPADFEVFDNGVAQRVELATFERFPLNVILTLDMSDSVSGERLAHLRAASRALLGGLKKEDQAALVTFSHAVVLACPLTSDLLRMHAALDQRPSHGLTALVDAAFMGLVLGESDVGRSLLIVFSDGLDNASFLPPEVVIQTARRTDVVAYAASTGKVERATFLDELTRSTAGSVFEIESTKDLNAVFLRVLEEFRQRYLVSYSPQGVSKQGWHRLEVRVKGRRAAVKARPGYLVGPDGPQ